MRNKSIKSFKKTLHSTLEVVSEGTSAQRLRPQRSMLRQKKNTVFLATNTTYANNRLIDKEIPKQSLIIVYIL